eukprot:9486329-Pyramimonas_sp.AAC.2
MTKVLSQVAARSPGRDDGPRGASDHSGVLPGELVGGPGPPPGAPRGEGPVDLTRGGDHSRHHEPLPDVQGPAGGAPTNKQIMEQEYT